MNARHGCQWCWWGLVPSLTDHAAAAVTAAILAGDETALPADTPSGRLDTAGEFAFVGSLAIAGGGGNYKGSAVALSPEWVLTAGHNVDLNDDGLPDAAWSGTFHLPGVGSFGVAQAFTPPGFTGFAKPAVNDDLALLHLSTPLPAGMGFPTLGSAAGLGEVITLVGFGRSGYGRLRWAVWRYRRRGVGGAIRGLDGANHRHPGAGNRGADDARRGCGGMAA
jgi:hypothetical protein